MAANYGQNILQSLGNYRQEQLLQQERDRQNQPNLVGGLAGLLGGALASGKLLPKSGGVDLASILTSPEAWGGGLTGAIQPTANTAKDIFTGGVAGIQSAQNVKKLAQEQAKLEQEQETSQKEMKLKEAKSLLEEKNLQETIRHNKATEEAMRNRYASLYGKKSTEKDVVKTINDMVMRRDSILKTLKAGEYEEGSPELSMALSDLEFYSSALPKLQQDYSLAKGITIKKIETEPQKKGNWFGDVWDNLFNKNKTTTETVLTSTSEAVSPVKPEEKKSNKKSLDSLMPSLPLNIQKMVRQAKMNGASEDQILQTPEMQEYL